MKLLQVKNEKVKGKNDKRLRARMKDLGDYIYAIL